MRVDRIRLAAVKCWAESFKCPLPRDRQSGFVWYAIKRVGWIANFLTWRAGTSNIIFDMFQHFVLIIQNFDLSFVYLLPRVKRNSLYCGIIKIIAFIQPVRLTVIFSNFFFHNALLFKIVSLLIFCNFCRNILRLIKPIICSCRNSNLCRKCKHFNYIFMTFGHKIYGNLSHNRSKNLFSFFSSQREKNLTITISSDNVNLNFCSIFKTALQITNRCLCFWIRKYPRACYIHSSCDYCMMLI